MPELPDVAAYLTALEGELGGRRLQAVALRSPFLVRTVEPPLDTAAGRVVTGFRRLGKRIVWELEGELFLVFHLMIAGRFHRRKAGVRPTRKVDLAAFQFDELTLLLTEAGSKKRASLHVVAGADGLAAHDPGGLEVLESGLEAFAGVLRARNHTLKRALTDPRLFSGIGNAYSDEILHAARLSPVKWTSRLTDEEVLRLYEATRSTLADWIARLRAEAEVKFPEKVTAFRPEMAVHGRCGQPCPVCGTAVQEIAYASRETNYCPRCQTGGKVLADRQLSRLLKDDWPKTIDALEARLGDAPGGAVSAVDVIGLGLITTDYLFRVPRLPAFGASLRASAFARDCGGPVATALACLARLGASTRILGKVGDDEEGEFLCRRLAAQGVDVTGVRRGRGLTRTALVLVEEATGERGFVPRVETHAPLAAADLTAADLAGARVLHLDDADEPGLEAARRARAAGALVVFDGTWVADGLADLLPLVDHAVVGEKFARAWMPEADDEAVLQRLASLGAGTTVLTLGERGSLARANGAVTRQPAFPVEVFDTTGAGDAFHGGYIHGLLAGWPLDRRLAFASATAALNCRRLGGQAGLPGLHEVRALLAGAA